MISMLIALWDLLRTSVICLVKGIAGMAMVATAVGLPIFIAGAIWDAFCTIFVLKFDWWIPVIFVVLSVYLIATGEGGE